MFIQFGGGSSEPGWVVLDKTDEILGFQKVESRVGNPARQRRAPRHTGATIWGVGLEASIA